MKSYYIDRDKEKIYIKEGNGIPLSYYCGLFGKQCIGAAEKYMAYYYSNLRGGCKEDIEVPPELWKPIGIAEEPQLPTVSARLDSESYMFYLQLGYQFKNTSALIREALWALMEKILKENEEYENGKGSIQSALQEY